MEDALAFKIVLIVAFIATSMFIGTGVISF